ncbi:MAG: DUF1552 domain-containing protein [Myxococcaceae bacterium]|nr:DUF1552 domain-containing protein [Myxococcaceae bacterium]
MKRFDRRAVLRGLGGVLISLPTLEGCTSLEGLATAPAREREVTRAPLSTARAKRFVAMMCPNGVYPPRWFPTGSERGFTLNTHNAPLEPIRQRLILTRGIANKVALDGKNSGDGNGHAEGVQSLLTGWAVDDVGGNTWRSKGGPSVDQQLADFFAANGYVARARGIHLGEEGVGGSYNSISVQANRDTEGTTNVGVLFDSPGAMTSVENARRRNQSVLDGSKADFQRLAQRVSGVDKQRIEGHLEALRSIEQRLALTTSCTNPNLPSAMNGDQQRDLYFDLLVAAFACDASRTATLHFFHAGGGGPKLPWLNIFEDIHEISHQVEGTSPPAASVANFDAYHQWWSRKTLRFVQRLQATPTADGGTLLDETVIFQGSEIAWAHTTPDMPFLLIAGEKTPFDTGRFVSFTPRAMHTHLLTTLLHAFGHPATQVGDPQYAPGNLDARLFKA